MLAFVFALLLPTINGRTILITGSTDGIGRETAKQLAEQGQVLVLHGRNRSRCDDITTWLSSRVADAQFRCFIGNFLDLPQVIALADVVKREVPELDTVLLNAGVFKDNVEYTQHGLEETFQVNHLAHFLLAHHLIDALKDKTDARIIFTSSGAHLWATTDNWDDFNATKAQRGPAWDIGGTAFSKAGITAYGRSKLLNLMTSDLLADSLQGTGATSNSLHPGHWRTKLSKWTGSPVEQVEILTYLAANPDVAGVTGKYFGEHVRENWEKAVASKNRLALDEGNKRKLCQTSVDILRSLNLEIPNPVC